MLTNKQRPHMVPIVFVCTGLAQAHVAAAKMNKLGSSWAGKLAWTVQKPANLFLGFFMGMMDSLCLR